MMKEIKHYFCDSIPQDEDLLKCIEIAKKEECLIDLMWFVEYNGKHNIIINQNSTLNDLKNELPKYYGL